MMKMIRALVYNECLTLLGICNARAMQSQTHIKHSL